MIVLFRLLFILDLIDVSNKQSYSAIMSCTLYVLQMSLIGAACKNVMISNSFSFSFLFPTVSLSFTFSRYTAKQGVFNSYIRFGTMIHT